jgi:prepilin-type processing-associated H-X9-DG protein
MAEGAKHIFNCPANESSDPRSDHIGYTPNIHLMPNRSQGADAVRLVNVRDPAQIILLADSNVDGPEPNPVRYNFSRWNWEDKIGFHRHNGVANALFLDGSVRQITPEEIDPKKNIWQPGL